MPSTLVALDGIGPELPTAGSVSVGASKTLVVWSDSRRDLGYSASDIFAARYSSDGMLLDPNAIAVSTTKDEELGARVAFGQGTFLVVWWAITRAPNGAGGDGLVRAARLTPDGILLDPEGIHLAANAGPPEVTFVKDRFLVAFESNAGGPLRVVSVSPLGGVIGEPSTIVPAFGYTPRIASDGDRALLSYTFEPSVTNRSIHLRVLDAGVNTLAELSWPTEIGFATEVGGGTSGFVVARSDQLGTSTIRRLDANGAWLDAAPLQEPVLGLLRFARDGDGYLIASSQGNPLAATVTRLADASSQLESPQQLPGAGPTYEAPAVASDGAVRAVAWESGNDISSVRVAPTGASLDATPKFAPHARTAQFRPVLARVGSTPLIAFQEESRDERRVRILMLDPTGATAEGTANDLLGASEAALASGGQTALVAWTRDNAIEAATISEGGQLGPSVTIAQGNGSEWESTAVDHPSAAATGSGFVVTYRTTDGMAGTLRARSCDGQGMLGAPMDLGSGAYAVPVAVGAHVVVVTRGDLIAPSAVLAASALDTEVPPSGLGKAAPGSVPALASDGTQALVVWMDHESRRVTGRLVGPSGVPLAPAFSVSSPGTEAGPLAVAFDGQHFVVVWTDVSGAWAELRGARVSASGAVIDPSGFVVSAEPGNEAWPAIAPIAGGLLVSYARFVDPLNALRVWTRTLLAP